MAVAETSADPSSGVPSIAEASDRCHGHGTAFGTTMFRRRPRPTPPVNRLATVLPAPERDEELDWIESLVSLGYGQNQSGLSEIEVQLLGSDLNWRAGRLEGLAPGDLLADFEEPILIGELVAIRLHSPRHRITAESLGLVHWRQRYLGRYLIGVFLREQLPERLLSQHWIDSRSELRFPARKSFELEFDSGRTRVEATVVNYSRSGARFVSRHAPTAGSTFDLLAGRRVAGGAVQFVRRDDRGRGHQFGCHLGPDEGLQLARAIQEHEAGGYEFWLQAPDPPVSMPVHADDWQAPHVAGAAKLGVF